MSQLGIAFIGGLAAVLTSLSYIPQVKKACPRGETSDLSLRMLVASTTGLTLWVAYGLLKSDWLIVLANSAGTILSATVLVLKVRDLRAG